MQNPSDIDKPEESPIVILDTRQESSTISPEGINGRSTTLRAAFISLITGQGAREGYLAAVDQGIISLSNFVATILLARASTPTELGVYGVGFTSLRLIRSIQEGITITPLNAFGAGMEDAEFKSYATSTSLIQLLLALFSAFAAALGGWMLTQSGNDIAGPTLFALWSPFLFWQLQEYIRRILYTRGHVSSAVINTILANGFRIALMIWWMRRDRLDGALSLQAIALGSLLALLPGVWQTRSYFTKKSITKKSITKKSIAQKFTNLKQVWNKNWNFGRWLIGSSLANWVSVEFYPVLTAGMISFAAAGAYRAIQNLVAPIHLLMRALDTFLTPRAARFYRKNQWAILDRLTRLTYITLGVPIFAILAVAVIFRAQLLEVLYGSTYLEYSNGIILMALFYALWFAYWPLQIILKAARISTPIFIANLFAIVAMFTVGIWMISQWGVYGTMAGQALNALVAFLVLAWFWIMIHRKPA